MSKFNKTKEWLIEEYVIKDRPRGLVASECGLTEAGLKSLLTKFNIKKEKLVIKEDKLKELINSKLHVDEIAKILLCSETSVYRAMYKYGLKILAAPRLKELYDSSLDFLIINLYQNKKMSSTLIGELLGVSHTYILTHLEHCGVKRRSLSESLFTYNGKDYPLELLDFDTIYDLYVNMKKSKKDLGIIFNCDPGVIDRVLTNFNIHIRNNSEAHIGLMTGEKHPNWKGGITKLSNRLREFFYVQLVPIVLERDNYKCQLCGKKGKLHVHHIKHFSDIVHRIVTEYPEYNIKDNINELYNIAIKDKELNDLSNLITYCPDCHRYKIHGYKRNILKADVKSIELLEYPNKDNQQPSLVKLEGSTTISKESTPKQEEVVEPQSEV